MRPERVAVSDFVIEQVEYAAQLARSNRGFDLPYEWWQLSEPEVLT